MDYLLMIQIKINNQMNKKFMEDFLIVIVQVDIN